MSPDPELLKLFRFLAEVVDPYLTKSLFKQAQFCPTSLYYAAHREKYQDSRLEDDFLQALADGGVQVGELARAHFPGGRLIQSKGNEEALEETARALEAKEALLFEPAFAWGRLFARVDILIKQGSEVQLIEVKAKSCQGDSEDQFLGKKGIKADYRTFLEDAAFQHIVVTNAQTDWSVTTSLMMLDKETHAPGTGLHQKFALQKGPDGRAICVQLAELTESERASGILTRIELKRALGLLLDGQGFGPGKSLGLADWAHQLQASLAEDARLRADLTSDCAKCPFRVEAGALASDQESGFDECWRLADRRASGACDIPVLDVWNTSKKGEWISGGKLFLDQIPEDFRSCPAPSDAPMEKTERQALQVAMTLDPSPGRVLRGGLADEMASWISPLHFIDFETLASPLPLFEGMRPYEPIAFQFSHHIVHEDGRVEHAGEFLQEDGFPNFELVRELRVQLLKDSGPIFRYHNHENTILRAIRRQLLERGCTVPDGPELIAFIDEITRPTKKEGDLGAGVRDMVDMHRLVRMYWYEPSMGGSISIKKVLPAAMKGSDFLREEYSQPVYGADPGIPSRNFQDQVWWRQEDGVVQDPYQLLGPVFDDLSVRDRLFLAALDEGEGRDVVHQGGTAMMAYSEMQWPTTPQERKDELRLQLKRYCELDTLAMVMIYQAWRNWLQ